MSGIAGVIRFDNRRVRRHELERVANALHQFGPDRSDIVTVENVGFVHALMRMTPEDRNDRQPHRGASGALITADLRIDNRDELLARLEISRAQAADWSDSAPTSLRMGKIRTRCMAFAARSFRSRDLGHAHPVIDIGARSPWTECCDVASERTFFCVREYAERTFCSQRRAPRIMRGKIR